jgi:mRNA interferase MazF/mRNA interferase ChpB
VGKEIMKRRPAFVISRKSFNEHTKMAIVALVTSTIKGIKLEIVLSDGTKTKGAILVYQLKSIDFIQRDAEFIEKVPDNIVKKVSCIDQLLVR